ncbi:MAG: hypothetical protein JRI25_18555, partial [Deltaproteobacteria bacterium]|nr:hypothetical protein [Deltaproteobacteria bacterium]
MSYVAAVPTSLSDRLAASESPADAALDIFLEWVDDTGIVPYPAQEEAV